MLSKLFSSLPFFFFFFFNDTATTEIYTLSLHDALPIWRAPACCAVLRPRCGRPCPPDRKGTRLNSSHVEISYAVFCLKKKKKNHIAITKKTTTKKKRRQQHNIAKI